MPPSGGFFFFLLMKETASAVIKAAPPVSVVGAYLHGFHVADAVMVLTLVYTTLQIYVLVRDKLIRR
jgi:ABC-type sulfate transport system permease component